MATATPTVQPDEQLAYEARMRSRMAALAVAGGVLLVVAAALQLGGPHTAVDELTTDLIVANKRFPLDLIASIINGIASLSIAAALAFLWRCSNARNRDVRGLHPRDRGGRRDPLRGHRDRLRDRGRREGPHLRQHGRSDLRGGQPPHQLRAARGDAADRPGRGAAARRRRRARVAERDAPGPAHPFHGLPGHLRGRARALPDHPDPDRSGLLVRRARLSVLRTLADRGPAGVEDRPGRALAPVLGAAGPPRRRRPRAGGRAPEPVAADGPPADAGRTRAATPKRKRKRRN